MLVRKQIALSEVHLKADAGKGTFEGYAARFGATDTYGDTILKGAFDYSLRKNGKPKMFFAHEWTMPIGKYTKCAEDDSGLYVAGEFTPGVKLADDVRSCMLHETLDGLSIGGFVSSGDATQKEDGSGQIITRFTRLVEISPVVFPADAGARIDLATVRGEDIDEAIDDIKTERDLERFLRDAGGYSKRLAAALVSRAKVIFSEGDPQKSHLSTKSARQLADRIERIGKLAA